MLTIEKIKSVVEKNSKKYGIKSAYLFGSYAKGEANENSDIDLLIDRGEIHTFMDLIGFKLDLVDELGTEVDIITTAGVKDRFLSLIKDERIKLYGD